MHRRQRSPAADGGPRFLAGGDAETVLVVGDADPYATAAASASIAATLASFAIPHRTVSFAGGHHLDAPVLGALLSQLGEVA